MERITGTIISIGSIAFLIAAFMPITVAFVIERNIASIQSRPLEWATSLTLFGLGGILTTVGLGLLTLQLRGNGAANLGILAFSAMAAGAVCWTVIVYLRYTLPLEVVFKEPRLGWWFVAYTLLTQVALIAYGWALVQGGYPRWLGLSTLGLAVASLIAFAVFKDMPPLVHYLISLMIGVTLLVWGGPAGTLKGTDDGVNKDGSPQYPDKGSICGSSCGCSEAQPPQP